MVRGKQGDNNALRILLYFSFLISHFTYSAAQIDIKIDGNVYGGGNQAKVKGNTTVTVREGDIDRVFGGARMADVGGRTFVNIEPLPDDKSTNDVNEGTAILINQVYGGNDISGTIGTYKGDPNAADTVPTALTAVKRVSEDADNPKKNAIDKTWNTFVRLGGYIDPTTHKADPISHTGDDDHRSTHNALLIGSLFAASNGEYDYDHQTDPESGQTTHYIYMKGDIGGTLIATKTTGAGDVGFQVPDIAKAYLEIVGGCAGSTYGGGNDATVTEKTVIYVDNPTQVVNEVLVNGTDILTVPGRIDKMGFNKGFTYMTSDAFQIGSFYGGNNRAEMAIRPTWNLQSGLIRNLYSGGNRGNMTSPEGLMLDIKPEPMNTTLGEDPTKNDYILKIDNVYGGCRMADVKPSVNGVYTPTSPLPGYVVPAELSARVIVRGGDINNVYGGNDVTGTVYGGCAVGIHTSVRGNVYGGGNGAYAYTNMLEDDLVYGDFYVNSTSIGALNTFRPNAEQVSLHLFGEGPNNPTVIHGSVFVGGNCATLSTKKDNPMVELKIGSNVIAENVYLGNNGEKMVDPDILAKYADSEFSTFNLKDPSVFSSYMDGVAMNLQPKVVFDSEVEGDNNTYIPYSSYIGSFFCGGNIGSMAISGKNVYNIDKGLNIYNKFVGGCNNAYVSVKYPKIRDGNGALVLDDKGNPTYDLSTPLNATYDGGVLGSVEENPSFVDGSGNIKDRLELNLKNLTITPMRWNDTFTQVEATNLTAGKTYYQGDGTTKYSFTADGTEAIGEGTNYYELVGQDYIQVRKGYLTAGQEYYSSNLRSTKFIADGTETVDTTDPKHTYYVVTALGTDFSWNTAEWNPAKDDFVKVEYRYADANTRLLDGNVYGGCYSSGHVNGNVVININEDIMRKDDVFGTGTGIYGYPKSGVMLDNQRKDLMALAMTVFGAGYGEATEIWGSTTVNLNKGYAFKIFGGGERGVVGKKNNSGNYVFNKAYSSTVNMNGTTTVSLGPDVSEEVSSTGKVENLAESELIYGGGHEGDVCGNTYVNLGNGRVYDAFGGASNANILGATEVVIGYNNGFPWVRKNMYGGNDFGATIFGKINHATETTRGATVEDLGLLESSTFVKYIQGRVDTIFGGNYGGYDYSNSLYHKYTNGDGTPKEGFSFPLQKDNSFVFFHPAENVYNSVGTIFGGSVGYPGNYKLNNSMQTESYVLLDDTETIESYKDRYASMNVFGGGSNAGVGLDTHYGAGRTVVDLFAGKFNDVYGGCNNEGLVGYSHVNVPTGSTIKLHALFGGSKGYAPSVLAATPSLSSHFCDNYVTCVDYNSGDAIIEDAIYGGNQNCRIACDTYLNITTPVMQSSGLQATIYGAGYGKETVSGRTNIFMNSGSNAYKVFGGGRDGKVFNYASLAQWLVNQYDIAGVSAGDIPTKLSAYRTILEDFGAYLAAYPITLPEHTGTYPNSSGIYEGTYTNDILPTTADLKTTYHNTNVHIMEGGNVSGYAYGGGFGNDAIVGGTTYIELKGGNVDRDIYGGGQGGHVWDEFNLGKTVFTPTTNVYIEGGMCRNVYGGGYLGHVGYHVGDLSGDPATDRSAVANVVVGLANGTSFIDGVPAITRNVYGGGEGGSVYGTTNVRINNGYIGYRYKNTGTVSSPIYKYVEELNDQKPGDLDLSGNVFGGGYVINSYVDIANVDMYGGTVRGSLYGGGEIGPIGRGTVKDIDSYTTGYTGLVNGDARIFKAGQTHVKMYNGHVLRNVFGGGRGKDSWGGDGTMYMNKDLVATLDMKVKGFVFGQTDVNIYGGEIGTVQGLALNYGNVFGGGDEGFVYSAYEQNGSLFIGKKVGNRYDHKDSSEGYYYRYNGSNYVNTTGETIEGDAEKFLTEDCHVLVEPWLQVKAPIPYGGRTYNTGDYIPTSYLNTLPKKDKNDLVWPEAWNIVDVGSLVGDTYKERGVIIHNAVFAGGNIAVGSELFANTKTVLGNATATIHDVYNRDLVTVGGIHIGGLYGDGNLTFVDGYRELNVTNYGTDYYNIKEEISNTDYKQLPPREQAYYELKYKCVQQCTDNEGTTYTVGSTIPQDELLVLFEGNSTYIVNGKPNSAYWIENGVVSRYAGRYLNTIQRADFCGVFGSRLVMKGAKDRVPEVADGTNYTINRVREVSLNKKRTVRTEDLTTKTSYEGFTVYADSLAAEHGNYFGIYSVVNHLGALTSDVDFQNATRFTNNKDKKKYKDPEANGKAYGTATFADWKEQFKKDQRRNNGLSHNELALASGVYLELTTEESTGNTLETKDWGIITGVVQLDLINVSKGMGGGFVYAKNIHGVREGTGKTNTLLSDLNLTGGINGARAATNKVWKYIETDATASSTQQEWQTSGNFVHNSQTIIDDCYNISSRYLMSNRVPAHYWYIRGSVYVYDQYITAHTGSPSAYSKNAELPITISAAARNQMKLLDVQPNLYAYYSSYNPTTKTGTPLDDEQKLLIQDNEYYMNTPISYWDWSLLPASERNLFVEETYVTTEKCKIGETIYPAGKVMLPSDYDTYEAAAMIDLTDDGVNNPVSMVLKIVQDENGNDVVATDSKGDPVYVPFESVFHASNDMGHDTGYLLTYKMTNPGIWDVWYTQANSAEHAKSQTEASGWEDGPTYYLNTAEGKLLGQLKYNEGDIIPQKIYIDYVGYDANGDGNYETGIDANNDGDYDDEGDTKDIKGLLQSHPSSIPTGQAEFGRAYVVTDECSSDTRHYYKGAPVSEAEGTSSGVSAAPAYICTGTVQLSATDYVFINDLMTAEDISTLKSKYPLLASDFDKLIVPAYYCTTAGLYGGSYYEAGMNYRALEAWSSMPESDRQYFTFNYDAFDLLIDPAYGVSYDSVLGVWKRQLEGTKYQYDSAAGTLAGAEGNPAQYSLETPLDYTATREGSTLELLSGQKVKVTRSGVEKTVDGDKNDVSDNSIQNGDVLERDEFEKLLNEQYHYAPIDVTDDNVNKTIYITNTAFYYKESYAAGQVIDSKTFEELPNTTELNLQAYVSQLTFSTEGIYYFCRDSYTIDGTNGTAVMDINNVTHAQNSTVDVGTILNSTVYGTLKNQQLGFTIHGVSPMETATLYVSRDADYDNLSKEKIITVIYQYDYEESDESGAHITPISERHVVRIHVTFENGIPTVEDIQEPEIVLPGTSITMRIPGVTSNGYEIIGGGWELFESKSDAESHFSGKEYQPSVDPLYWYQDDFYLAYYAKTYNRGKTYSNAVPVHVANYHDLKEVMDDKENHLHVDYDRTRLKRDSKIYINDYSDSHENGLDLFKDFYNLSVLEGASVDENGLMTTGSFIGHKPLNNSTATGTNIYDRETYTKGVKAGTNLEFFFRTDIDHTKKWVTNPAHALDPSVPEYVEEDNSWTAIGTDEQCFKGTIHGDGHTIKGLNNSLFYNLCGDVYNLGVMGSFTSAGVVDKGNGYVESCWTSTTGTPADANVYAVFGNPSRTSEEIDQKGPVQMVNSYYQEGKTYNTTAAIHGVATPKPAKAFYDGELAYDLNSFYLNKRFYQGTNLNTSNTYKYWPVNNDGTLPTDVSTGYYPTDGYAAYGDLGYVEARFADGDFRYAGHEIPTSENERYYEEKGKNLAGEDVVISTGYYPLWPDDYIFFGQKLTYGYSSHQHQEVPTAVARDGGRLSQNDDANRVYRAPAYYRSKNMGMAHFNPTVYLAQKEKLTDEQVEAHVTPREAYPGMTAIDFAGHNGANEVDGTYVQGQADASGGIPALFYPPLLDDDGLVSITNCDETQNLLVYAPAASGESGYVNAKTHGVLTSYFTEPEYEDYYHNTGEYEGYRLVDEAPSSSIHGHLVQSDKTATNDHLLVDKEEFNCPMAYTFDADHLMWYQRTPTNTEFVDNTKKGWQGISLPFTAELVTTHQKGEITHFFSGSANSFNGTGTKILHEYWLREFNKVNVGDGDVATAYLRYPDATGSDPKTVDNTFLWDYYYENTSVHNQLDANDNTYLQYQQYYNGTRQYDNYPLLGAATPYILGLPGQTYYEFDLSGNFVAKNTAKSIDPLDKQIVTFASKLQTAIAVSDDEILAAKATYTKHEDGSSKTFDFTFAPNYLKQTLTADDYAMNADGNAFNKVGSSVVTTVPFRPYFTATSASKSPARRMMPSSIVFSGGYDDLNEESPESVFKGTLEIYTRGRNIVATSHLSAPTTVNITTTSGVTIAEFVLEPDQTVETPVKLAGVYIINKKKLIVK